MAKLTGPLLSFGATGSIADSVTFTDRKRQHVAKSLPFPSNPNTTGQSTQRGYVSAASQLISAARVHPTQPMNTADFNALALLAHLHKSPLSWYNVLCKNLIDVAILGGSPGVFRNHYWFDAGPWFEVVIRNSMIDGINITSVNCHYGFSPSVLTSIQACSVPTAPNTCAWQFVAPVPGAKYYFQYVVPAGELSAGLVSGIYSATFVP